MQAHISINTAHWPVGIGGIVDLRSLPVRPKQTHRNARRHSGTDVFGRARRCWLAVEEQWPGLFRLWVHSARRWPADDHPRADWRAANLLRRRDGRPRKYGPPSTSGRRCDAFLFCTRRMKVSEPTTLSVRSTFLWERCTTRRIGISLTRSRRLKGSRA